MAATPGSQVSVCENQQPQQPKIQIYAPCNDEVSDFWRGRISLPYMFSFS